MRDSALGFLLRELRKRRGLTLREVAQLADIDHAYLQRLEIGEKTSPSDEVIGRLARALKASKRETQMLHFLARYADMRSSIVEFVLDDPAITYEEFRGLATYAYRGSARPDFPTALRRLRAMWSDENGHR